MEIKTYKKASEIEEKYLSSLVDSEIECWWSRPFDEYKICSNSECRALYSIEDIYENIKNYRNRLDDILSHNHKCEICDYETEFVYEKEKFLEMIKEYVKWEVSLVLLIDNEKVEWFWVLSKDSLENIMNFEFATRPNSYDTKYIYEKLDSNLEFNLIHQIFISEKYRWFWYFKLLFNQLLNFCNLNSPIILETMYNSKFYSIIKSLDWINILSDRYWYVVMYLLLKNQEKIKLKNNTKLNKKFYN